MIYLSINLSIYLSIYLFIYLSINPSIHLLIHHFISLVDILPITIVLFFSHKLERKVYVIDTTASKQLQKQLQSTVKQCFRFCLLLFCPIFLVIIGLLIAVYCLDCPARYQLFHNYEHLSFLQFTTVADNQNNSSLKLIFWTSQIVVLAIYNNTQFMNSHTLA